MSNATISTVENSTTTNYTNYYDAKNRKFYRPAQLKLKGFPIDLVFLRSQQIYPLVTELPKYDKDIEKLHVDSNSPYPHPKEDDPLVYTYDVSVVPLEESALEENLSRIAQEKADEARQKSDETLAPLLVNFSSSEQLTFTIQAAEVAAYQANPETASTPMLDGLAASRGITREEQIAKAATKATAFSLAAQTVVGKQQGYEDEIKQIQNDAEKTTKEKILALKALTFEYELPSLA